MSNIEYKLNPIKGAMCYLNSDVRIINELNDVCTDICDAFGQNGLYNNTECNNICSNEITNINIKNGYSKNYPRRPLKPPVFIQSPHYFPTLFYSNQEKMNINDNIKYSTNKCIDKCNLDNDIYKEECIMNCKRDAGSIIPIKNIQKNIETLKNIEQLKNNETIPLDISSPIVNIQKITPKEQKDISNNFFIVWIIICILIFISIYVLSKLKK